MNELSEDKAINRIEQVYHARYDSESDFDVYAQLLACEAYAEAEEEHQNKYEDTNDSGNVNGSVNATYKRKDDFELTNGKQEIIARLKEQTHKTPIFEVANLLEELFAECGTNSGHWPYVAEKWNPRAINWVLKKMTKLHGDKWKSLQNPAAYFTQTIKYYEKRRSL